MQKKNKNKLNQRVVLGVLFLILNLLSYSFSESVKNISYLYLFEFIFTVYYYVKNKTDIISLFFVIYIFINLYCLTPVLNFLFIGKPILFFYTKETIFAEYVLLNTILNSLVLLFFSPQKNNNTKDAERFVLSEKKIFFTALIGFVLFVFQINFTGALSAALSGGGKTDVFNSLGNYPRAYLYFLPIALYFLVKRNSFYGIKISFYNLTAILFVGLYIFFFLYIGARSEALVYFIIGVFAVQSVKKVSINIKLIFFTTLAFTIIAFVSISNRWRTGYDIKETYTVLKENPESINIGTLEYTWGLENYHIMRQYNFEQKFLFKTYIDQFIGPIQKVFDLDYKSVYKEYRDKFHSERKVSGGDYSTTGFSLIYESIMNFGFIFFWIPIILFYKYLRFIDERFYKDSLYEIYFVFIIPFFMHPGRTGILILIFITKYMYSLLFNYYYKLK